MSLTPSDNSTRTKAKMADREGGSRPNKLILHHGASKPIGISLFGSCFKFSSETTRQRFHKSLVLFLTFIAYVTFHMGRRPFSIVINVLNRDCDEFYNRTYPVGHGTIARQHGEHSELNTTLVPRQKDTSCNWAPFDDDATANRLFAYLDTAFLTSYAIFMLGSGVIAERTNLRYVVAAGSILSGFALFAFGIAYPLQIHSMTYFIAFEVFAGAAHSTGWPVVVTCVGNWLDASSRGLIYGIWNSHTNLGNILGATIAGYYVETDWGLSFVVPGWIMVIVGLILFLFLVPSPRDVNLNLVRQNDCHLEPQETSCATSECQKPNEFHIDLENSKTGPAAVHKELKAVSFITALRIPGVIEFSFCLFFSKLVSYTFLYWLPRYIASSTSFNSKESAYLSTPFDVGGIIGGILAGYLSDRYRKNGIICNIMLLLAIPTMFVYRKFGAYSSMHNILLQLMVGLLVNGPYCLITTAVSADLGFRIKDGRAMATVSAIIDGLGSLGSVLGPLFAGLIPAGNWNAIFLMLMMSDVLAALCIARVTIQDVKSIFKVA